jgi:methyl-accepting chemotaxis protein
MSLTDEDKQWIGERLDQVNARIVQVNVRIEQVDARIEQVDARVEQVNARVEQVNARVEQVETRLLTEFHNWASPVEMRLRTHTATLRAIDLELEGVADRVTKLEGPEAQ